MCFACKSLLASMYAYNNVGYRITPFKYNIVNITCKQIETTHGSQ